MKKLLINASNLHNGGGVQVATSFIAEIAENSPISEDYDLHLYISNAVFENLKSTNVNLDCFEKLLIIDVRGLGALKKDIYKKFVGFDIVFTVFGPLYLPRRIKNHIVGFAQAWILYPGGEAYNYLPLRSRIFYRLKYSVQWLFFRWTAIRLVVELQHVKDRLVSFKGYPADCVDVVNNCISAIYFNENKWMPIHWGDKLSSNAIKIGYLSRAYSHKNLQILLAVAKEISKIGACEVRFFVTLNSDEWSSFSDEYRSTIINVGPLTVAQCPSFYQAMDGVLFASVLECFSATPLEAMAMRRPLFASDRGFVRDCCKENAVYIDPVNAEDIAKKIINWFTNMSNKEQCNHIDRAYRHVVELPNSGDRALGYMQIIDRQVENIFV